MSTRWKTNLASRTPSKHSPERPVFPLAGKPAETYSCPVKQYRPDVDRAKWLYSMRQSRAWVKRNQDRPEGSSRVAQGLKPIPAPWPRINASSCSVPLADETAALHMLGRFLIPNVAQAALHHPSVSVRGLGMRFLHELADDGNPLAAEILRSLP